MKYLVLGSEGQIGKPLVNFLRSQGHHVEEYDLRRSSIEDLRYLDRSEQREVFNDKLTSCDFVFFLAFDVGGSKYLSKKDNEFEFIHNNISLMKNTFELLYKHRKPFIFTSTQMSDMVHSSYGNAKLIGEKYTKSLNGLHVKLWNVYGPELDIEEERCHVITDFVRSARNNGCINMRTSGREKRQFLYVEDCCEALLSLSKKYDTISRDEQLHISNFEWTSIEQVAKVVSKFYNCEYTRGQKKDTVQLNLQYEPDRNILKYWQPKTTLENGIEKVINCYSKGEREC
jgi:nucleoside-diphosphate-sugar epimerase